MPLSAQQLQVAAEAAKAVGRAELSAVFDPSRPGSRPTEKQWEFFRDMGRIQYRWIVSANQAGKTSTAAREIAWILNGDHPLGWRRPPEWGTGPLVIIVATQDRRLCELELWEAKIKPFLRTEDWREVRTGNSLQHAENRRTGDRLIFLTHSDSSERNRKHLQGFVAHYVLCDEMPASIAILEELQRRVDSRRGYFVSSFTPKFRSVAIKKVVDSSVEPQGKKYTITKFQNPLFAGQEQEELAKLAGHSQDYIDAVLYGKWMQGDGAIYNYNADLHGGALPEDYTRAWRHVLVVDPATESKLGMTLWGEDPHTGMWWLVYSDYVEGIYVPTAIIAEVESRVETYNVMMRRADSQATWYIRQAAAMGYKYSSVEYKNGTSKDEFIARAQEAMGARFRIPEFNTALVEELQTYERNAETGQIIKASKYHLIDCMHYFAHRIPAPDVVVADRPWWHHLREADEIRRDMEARAQNLTNVRQMHRHSIDTAASRTNPLLRPAPGSPGSPASRAAANRARHNRVWRRTR